MHSQPDEFNSPDTDSPRSCILFQPPNHVGLGHISRLAAIALCVREICPGINVLFAVEGDGHGLLDALGLPYLSIPSAHALFKSSAWNSWTQAERRSLALEISRAILVTLSPRLLVFDCFPYLSMARAAIQVGVPMVLCLREMKDTAGHLSIMSELAPHFAAVLAPHDPQAIDAPEPWRSKMHFVGRIARPPQHSPAGNTQGRIVVTGGGGGGRRMVNFYNLVLEALAQARREDPHLECMLVTGPLFTDWRELRCVDGIKILPFVADMPELFASADLVISSAGYNTAAEVESAGVRAIFVPAPRSHDDQQARAERQARENPHLHVFRGKTATEMLALIHQCLGGSPPPRGAPPVGGYRAAQLLIDWLHAGLRRDPR